MESAICFRILESLSHLPVTNLDIGKESIYTAAPFFGLLRFLLPESFFLCADFLFGQYFEASLALFYATNSIAC